MFMVMLDERTGICNRLISAGRKVCCSNEWQATNQGTDTHGILLRYEQGFWPSLHRLLIMNQIKLRRRVTPAGKLGQLSSEFMGSVLEPCR
jgi:hypothetical protein